ncbi:MAG: nucleotidyltransferase family protein [Solirubrobacteraceae bacterium]
MRDVRCSRVTGSVAQSRPDLTDAATAASTFRLDIKGAEIRQAFEAACIRTVLLKGPATGHLLYPVSGSRSYSDVDLLVDPAAVQGAEKILAARGFRRFDDESAVRQTDTGVGRIIGAQGASHSAAWLRERDSFVVDLHDSLPQVGAPQSIVWRQLTQHLDLLTVAGVPTEILDRPASALLVALHAAHHGPDWDSTASDLERALEVFNIECWKAARDLAVELQAETPMGIGLGLTEAGRRIARQLSLPTEPSPAILLLWAGVPWSASVIDSLLGQRDLRAAATLIARIMWPTPDALRRGSALARRSRRWLVVAYVLRPFQLARRLPAALRTRRQASI